MVSWFIFWLILGLGETTGRVQFKSVVSYTFSIANGCMAKIKNRTDEARAAGPVKTWHKIIPPGFFDKHKIHRIFVVLYRGVEQ